jgi:hypothetical protein
MIVVLRIVIFNNGFYCRKSYRLLKRHQNSTLSAISRPRYDIITWILIESAYHCQNSRNCYSNSEQYTVLMIWRHYNFVFATFATKHEKGRESIIKVFLFTKLLLGTQTNMVKICLQPYNLFSEEYLQPRSLVTMLLLNESSFLCWHRAIKIYVMVLSII